MQWILSYVKRLNHTNIELGCDLIQCFSWIITILVMCWQYFFCIIYRCLQLLCRYLSRICIFLVYFWLRKNYNIYHLTISLVSSVILWSNSVQSCLPLLHCLLFHISKWVYFFKWWMGVNHPVYCFFCFLFFFCAWVCVIHTHTHRETHVHPYLLLSEFKHIVII